MKERPIIFSGESVRAILDGRKTQTRRVVRCALNEPHPRGGGPNEFGSEQLLGDWPLSNVLEFCDGRLSYEYQTAVDDSAKDTITCPYGHPSDQLWVRETWAPAARWGGDGTTNDRGYLNLKRSDVFLYRADHDGGVCPIEGGWKPSIYMTKEACRLRLRVTGVRVERLQEITFADVISEGILEAEADCELGCYGARGCPSGEALTKDNFADLWDSLNEGRGFGWGVNPWVWVVEFEQIDRQ